MGSSFSSAMLAFAHAGDHSGFSFSALTAHLFEPDHIVFAAITIATGIFAYRAGRRAEARAHVERDRSK